MGFKLVLNGNNEEIVLEKDSITSVKYISDTPNNSNARATDLSVGLEIEGKITNEKEDITKKLCNWSLVPAEVEEAYKNLNLEIISAGTVIRKMTFPNVFLVDYSEDYNTQNGVGKFSMILKQKKEKISLISIEGGYSAM